MVDLDGETQRLNNWYRDYIQPFLLKVDPERLEALSKDLANLNESRHAYSSELAICFLGNSGVGKSTLINALVSGSETVVPSGGIGPLTAQALTVRFAEQPRFEAEYHPLKDFWQLVFALEQSFRKELSALLPDAGPSAVEDYARQLSPEEMQDLTDTARDSSDETTPRERYRKLAQLMVTGSQDSQVDLDYLVDRMRAAAGKKPIFGTEPTAPDLERINRLRTALELAKSGDKAVFQTAEGQAGFRSELRAHASGFLAPLIKNLDVYWPSELLRNGVVLVDLPGVGVAGDVYSEVTRKWIREQARAVVMVVERSGVTKVVADLRRKSEFLNRLLYSADEPKGDPILLVAVVRVDDVADTRYQEDSAKFKKRREHFADVCEESKKLVINQVRQQLEAVWSSSEGPPSDGRSKVIENVLSTLQVHSLSAVQLRRLLTCDPDDPPFITDSRQSNVPQLAESLAELARQQRSIQKSRWQERRDIFVERVSTTLKLIQEQWQGGTRAVEEAERLRGELEGFMQPLRKELHVRQGQYRAFIKKGVPTRISDLVTVASATARNDIHKYLNRLGYAHWATLRASVRRGGRFSGAMDIDLPREFALRFEGRSRRRGVSRFSRTSEERLRNMPPTAFGWWSRSSNGRALKVLAYSRSLLRLSRTPSKQTQGSLRA